MLNVIKNIIKISLPEEIQFFIIHKYSIYHIKSEMSKKYLFDRDRDQTIYLLGTPTFSNIGDHAISLAECRFLNKVFPEYRIIEIPLEDLGGCMGILQKSVKPNDVICFQGGGNMGTEYYEPELFRRLLCRHFSNKIVFMPQTVDYEENGIIDKIAFIRAKKIYKKCANLYIFAREHRSFETMYKNFGKKVYETLDIVLSYDQIVGEEKRKGVIFCLRNDKERMLKAETINELLTITERYTSDISFTDMVADKKVNLSEREKYVHDKMKELSCAQVVITDRIHGMIFCALTRTPCIIFDNYNFKVYAEYEKIKEYFSYLKYVRNDVEYETTLERLINEEYTASAEKSMEKLQDEFSMLERALKV